MVMVGEDRFADAGIASSIFLTLTRGTVTGVHC